MSVDLLADVLIGFFIGWGVVDVARWLHAFWCRRVYYARGAKRHQVVAKDLLDRVWWPGHADMHRARGENAVQTLDGDCAVCRSRRANGTLGSKPVGH